MGEVTRSIVEDLIKKGWKWSKTALVQYELDGKKVRKGIRMLCPPENDYRINWCGIWMPYKKTGKVPHWAVYEILDDRKKRAEERKK